MAVGGQAVASVREQRVESEEVHAVSGLPSPPLISPISATISTLHKMILI